MKSELTEHTMRLLSELENDLEAQGWDQPSTLYVIEAVDDDPYLIKIVEFHDHPCEVLDSLPPLNRSIARGVVLAYEGWTVEMDGDLVQRSYALLEEMGVPRGLRDEIVNIAMERLMPTQPSQHEDRVECRFVQAMLRNGTSLTVMRKRGAEPRQIDTVAAKGRIDTAMRRVICVEAME